MVAMRRNRKAYLYVVVMGTSCVHPQVSRVDMDHAVGITDTAAAVLVPVPFKEGGRLPCVRGAFRPGHLGGGAYAVFFSFPLKIAPRGVHQEQRGH